MKSNKEVLKMKQVNSRIIEYVKGGFFKGVGIGAGLLTTSIFAAAAAMNVFSPGQTISAAQINQNFAIAAPEGAIMAFYLSACPEGWAPADGTNGTPDLRGVFVRGRNDAGTGARADGYQDPAGSRAIGDTQADAFQGHRFNLGVYGNVPSLGSALATSSDVYNGVTQTGDPVSDGTNGSPRTASETRPKNVALTYCMRKN